MVSRKKYYAGIGSRDAGVDQHLEMQTITGILEDMGYTLRSGNATGSDQFFASAVDEKAQIWLPVPDFEKNFRDQYPKHDYRVLDKFDSDAWESVNKFHPNPDTLSEFVRSLMARNFRQIRGMEEEDSSFVICWTKDGKASGGTGQALRIAEHYKIPIFNLFLMPWEEIIDKIKFLEQFKN